MNPYPLSPQVSTGPPFAPDIGSHLRQLLENGTWASYSGAALEQLSSAIQEYSGCNSLLCSSGSIAVELALRACKIQAGDEVILAGYDYPGNFRCIEAVKALAVVVDLAPHSWSMDLSQLQAAITARTKAMIVSHLHGEIQDLKSIREIADRYGILVIEDACQGIGGRLEGLALGSLGHIGIWSFGGSKLLTAGRGGALLCNDPTLMQRARVASQRGNDAMALSQLQAAVLIPQMNHLAEATARRFDNAKSLTSAWKAIGWCEPVKLNHTFANTIPAFYKFGVMVRAGVADRDRLVQLASSRGAELGPGFRGFASRSTQRCRRVSDLTHARRAGEQTLLIHHRHLTSYSDLQRLADALSSLANESL